MGDDIGRFNVAPAIREQRSAAYGSDEFRLCGLHWPDVCWAPRPKLVGRLR